MTRSHIVVLLVLALAGCTSWGTQEVFGQREVARQMLGSPMAAETKSSSLDAGFDGRSNRGTAVAGVGATTGSVTLKHCVQQAELTFEQSYQAWPELNGRGGDLGFWIGMGAVGAYVFASAVRPNTEALQLLGASPTAGYVVGGALVTAAIGLLVRSYVIVPRHKPAAGPTQTRQWIETRLVESSGCGLPGDVPQLQPAVPVLSPPQPATSPDAMARLNQLDKLRAASAVSETEYARKRKEIVDGI